MVPTDCNKAGNRGRINFRPRKTPIPALDGLRGIAILLVLWAHLPEWLFGPYIEALRFGVQPGYLGVDLFFVLSGFLITRILLTGKVQGKPLKTFFIRRFWRIFPVYYLTILVVLLWEPGTYLVWCATYLSNFYYAIFKAPSPMQHTWSLAVEQHFYLVWPFLVYGLTPGIARRGIAYGVLPLATILAIVTAVLEPRLPAEADGLVYRITFYRVFSLGLGALFAYSERSLCSDLKRLLWIALRFLVPAVLIIPTVLVVDHRWVGPIMLIGFGFLSGWIFLTTLAIDKAGRFPAESLTMRQLTYVGKISYGLYIYHLPIFFAMGVRGYPEGNPPTMTACALALGLSFAVAVLSYHLIEQPLLRRVRS